MVSRHHPRQRSWLKQAIARRAAAFKIGAVATATATTHPHISIDPGVCSGRPRIAGTRIRVMDVVSAYKEGTSPAELEDYFDSRPLTPAEIHSALAYYYDHKDEIDADFGADARLSAEGEKREAELLKRRNAR